MDYLYQSLAVGQSVGQFISQSVGHSVGILVSSSGEPLTCGSRKNINDIYVVLYLFYKKDFYDINTG